MEKKGNKEEKRALDLVKSKLHSGELPMIEDLVKPRPLLGQGEQGALNSGEQPVKAANTNSHNVAQSAEAIRLQQATNAKKPVVKPRQSFPIAESQSTSTNFDFVKKHLSKAVLLLSIPFLIGASAFIKYPDEINTNIVLDQMENGFPIIAGLPGSLKQIIANQSEVSQGDLICVVEDGTTLESIESLKEELSAFKSKVDKGWKMTYYTFPEVTLNQKLDAAYNELKTNFKNRTQTSTTSSPQPEQYTDSGYSNQDKITGLEMEAKQLEESFYRNRNELYAQYKPMMERGEMPATEFQQRENALNQNLAELRAKKAELENLKKNSKLTAKSPVYTQTSNTNIDDAAWKASYSELKELIEFWEEDHVIFAETSGTLKYIVSDNSDVRSDQKLALIQEGAVMSNGEEGIGQLNISGKYSKFVRPGQEVSIRMNKFKNIKGEIVDIDSDDSDEIILKVQIILPDDFNPSEGTKGQAKIVTKEISVFSRIGSFFSNLF